MPRRTKFRLALGLFVAGLVVSGLTAFPLQYEVELLCAMLGISEHADPASLGGLSHWLAFVRQGLRETYAAYPFMGYSSDWLAFGHLVIAMFFVPPIVWPERDHRATLTIGMIACTGVIPLALVAGEVRGVPWGWRLIDCAFGVIGIVPLLFAWRVQREDKRTPAA